MFFQLHSGRTLRKSSQLHLTRGARNLRVLLNQLSQDGWNPSEFNGLIKEEIRSGSEALLAILRIGVVRADQNLQVRMVCANSSQNIKPAASRHLQVENKGIWFHPLYASYSFRHISGLPNKFCPRHLFQQVRQALHDNLGVIDDEDPHRVPFSKRIQTY